MSKQNTETKTSNTSSTNSVVVFTDLLGIVNHGYSLTWCKSIFSYLGPSEKETLQLRCYCKLFSKALKPLPCWTTFPHPNYSSLNRLFDRFTELLTSGSTNIPKMLLIKNGIHEIKSYHGWKYSIAQVQIDIPIFIIGESREHCIVMGGLKMNGSEEDDVSVRDLTIASSKGVGVEGFNRGASFHLDNVSVENSGCHGVAVYDTKRNTMKNCNVSHSENNGLVVMDGGVITISGNGTKIHHNCTDGDSGSYGLYTNGPSSSIHLVSPLTPEMISTNNGDGGNQGGNGTIKSVDKDGKVLNVTIMMM